MRWSTSAAVRKVFRITIGLLLVGVVLCLLLLAYLTTPPGENWIRGLAEIELQRALGAPVRIGWLETNLVTRLQIRAVRIFSDSSTAARPLAAVGFVRVHYRPWRLPLRQLDPEAVVIDSLVVEVARDSAGRLELPFQFKDAIPPDFSVPASSMHLRLGRVQLTCCSVRYNDRLIPLDANLENLGFELHEQKAEHFRWRSSADSLRCDYAAQVLKLENIQLAGDWAEQRLSIDTLSASLHGLKIAANAAVDLSRVPSPTTGNLQINGDPAGLRRALSELSRRSR